MANGKCLVIVMSEASDEWTHNGPISRGLCPTCNYYAKNKSGTERGKAALAVRLPDSRAGREVQPAAKPPAKSPGRKPAAAPAVIAHPSGEPDVIRLLREVDVNVSISREGDNWLVIREGKVTRVDIAGKVSGRGRIVWEGVAP